MNLETYLEKKNSVTGYPMMFCLLDKIGPRKQLVNETHHSFQSTGSLCGSMSLNTPIPKNTPSRDNSVLDTLAGHTGHRSPNPQLFSCPMACVCNETALSYTDGSKGSFT